MILLFCFFFIGDTEACLLDAQQRAANLQNEVSKKDANIEALVKNSRSQTESAIQAQNVTFQYHLKKLCLKFSLLILLVNYGIAHTYLICLTLI